jgi:kumamolisin
MTQRKLFHDSVVELPQEAAVTPTGVKVNARGPEHSDEKMTVSFSLSPDKAVNDELEARVAQGDVVPIDELQKKYGVTEEAVAPLLAWLKKRDSRWCTSRPTATAYSRAPPSRRSSAASGSTWCRSRATGSPTQPRATRRACQPTWRLMCAPSAGCSRSAERRSTCGASAQPARRPTMPMRRPGPAPNIANAPPYLVSEVLKAYNADGLGVTGKGQTIAILIDTVPSNADLKAFWTRNGLHTTIAQVTKINVSSVPLPPTEGEETLDAQWTSGIAPGRPHPHLRQRVAGVRRPRPRARSHPGRPDSAPRHAPAVDQPGPR